MVLNRVLNGKIKILKQTFLLPYKKSENGLTGNAMFLEVHFYLQVTPKEF